MSKTYIIAEVGINHNGKIELAEKLICAAKNAGADAVKFQKRDINKVYTQEELNKYRESPWGKTNREQKQGLEFTLDQYEFIDRLCQDLRIDWFISPWDMKSATDMQNKFNFKTWKLASALITHTELVKYIASLGKYTYISTGMSTIEEIGECVAHFDEAKCPFELMSCNSQYPTPDDKVNLATIYTLKDIFECKVGYSGHSAGIIDGVLAVAMGATSVEKHITLDRAMYGSDQSASLEPVGFTKMVEYIRTAEKMIGEKGKIITEAEEATKAKLRRTKDYDFKS